MSEVEAIGAVSHSRVPEAWSEAAWRDAGAFTAVFLNYNKAKTIRRSVEATLAQDCPALEILFMDDASTDGSGDVMEEIVRAYRGLHKVAVVRNPRNLGICGQWNQVKAFTDGEWFGMFCADDVPHADRVSSVAALMRGRPSLRGVCTAMDPFDLRTGEPRPDCAYPPGEVFEVRGDETPEAIGSKKWPVGCTSFWRRCVFSRPLPRVALDDLLIKWILHMDAVGDPGVVWMYDGRIATIDYGVGEGLWSQLRASRDPAMDDAEWRRVRSERVERAERRNVEAWRAIREEAASRGEACAGFRALAERRIVRHAVAAADAAGARLGRADAAAAARRVIEELEGEFGPQPQIVRVGGRLREMEGAGRNALRMAAKWAYWTLRRPFSGGAARERCEGRALDARFELAWAARRKGAS